MSWKDLKIAQKLYLGFGAVLLLTLLTGYTGYNGLSNYSASVANSDDAGTLAKWIKDVAVARRDYYLTKDEKHVETIKSLVADMTKLMDGTKARMETQEEKDAVERVSRLLNGDYLRVLTAQMDNVRAQAKAQETMESAENAARDLVRSNAGLNRYLADLQDCRVPAKTYLIKSSDQEAAKVNERLTKLAQDVGGSSNSLQMALTAFKDNFNTVVKARSEAEGLTREIGPMAAELVKGIDDIRETEQQNMRQAKSTAVTLALTFVFGALAIGIFVAYFISRAIANPIKAIAQVADDVSTGDIQHDIHFESKDEIGVLAESFRRLIDYMKSLAGAAEQIAENDLTVQFSPRVIKTFWATLSRR